MSSGWLVGETVGVHRLHQEVSGSPRSIAGKHAPGAIRAVCGRCEPYDEQACARVAEPGHGLRPIYVVAVRGLLDVTDTDAIFPQASAVVAVDNSSLRAGEEDSHRFS